MTAVERLVVGALEANCYIIWCTETKECLVIDPGGDAELILKKINEKGLKARSIIDTHGHVDHIAANAKVKEATGAELLVHALDESLLTSRIANLSMFTGEVLRSVPPDRTLQDGDIVQAGGVSLQVLHTPGHTKGSISLVGEGMAFTGDTLFAGSVGRTDLPGGSYSALLSSIKDKLMTLPGETVVYPGHGPSTTIDQESRHNPFLR